MFRVQQTGSPNNQSPTPLASRTLPLTHHPSPGPRGLVHEVSPFLGVMRDCSRKGMLNSFYKGPGLGQRERPPGQSPCSPGRGAQKHPFGPTTATAVGSHRMAGLSAGRSAFLAFCGPGAQVQAARARPGTSGRCLKLELAEQSTFSPRRHTSCSRNAAAARPPLTFTFHPQRRSSRRLFSGQFPCRAIISRGMRGLLARRTSTLKTFSPRPSRPQANPVSRPSTALDSGGEAGTGTLPAQCEIGTAARSSSSPLPGSVRAADPAARVRR